jgi:hypothetical protein
LLTFYVRKDEKEPEINETRGKGTERKELQRKAPHGKEPRGKELEEGIPWEWKKRLEQRGKERKGNQRPHF